MNKLIGEQHINSKKAKNKNRTRKNNKEVKSKKSRKLWKKIITIILILCIICILAFAAFFAIVAITAPKFDPEAFNTQEQTVIYDINGNEIECVIELVEYIIQYIYVLPKEIEKIDKKFNLISK